MLDLADLDALVPDLAERETFACGPGGLLDALEAHHDERGPARLLHRAVPGAAAGSRRGRHGARSSSTGTTVECDGATPILDAGEEAGVLMPCGCRMGICFGCVLPLREGAVRDLRTGEITTAARGRPGGGLIQTCINAAAGPCDFDH